MLIDIDKVLQKAEKIKNKKLKFNEHEQTIDRPTYSTSAKHKPWYQGNDFSFDEYEQTKPESNWSQTGVKSGVEPETNLESNWSQTEVNNSSCELACSETGVKPEPELESQVKSKQSQIEVKVKSNAVAYTSLVGLQKELILLIYNECNKSRSKVTNPLTIEFIFSLIRYKKSSVKAAIRRLEKKGYIKRYSFKNGRGGWSQYTIPDHLFHEILNLETSAKLESKWSQTEVKLGSQVGLQVESIPVVSSSYIINTTTTLPEEIKRIDYSPLADVGFNESHLIQIHREHMQKPELSLSADIIQNSINQSL